MLLRPHNLYSIWGTDRYTQSPDNLQNNIHLLVNDIVNTYQSIFFFFTPDNTVQGTVNTDEVSTQ